MLANQEKLQALYTSFVDIFKQNFNEATTVHEKIATVVPSDTRQNNYAWLGSWPMLREWVGERVVKALAAQNYTVVNKSFEATVGVPRDDIEDDTAGVYEPLIAKLGINAKKHPDKLVFDLLKNGTTGICYDGQPFFDTAHPLGDEGGSVWSNFTDGASTAWYLMQVNFPLKPLIFQMRREAELIVQGDPKVHTSVMMRKEILYGVDYRGNAGYGLPQLAHCSKAALNETNYPVVRQFMMELTNEEGEPLEIKPDLIVVPPSLEMTAKKLFGMSTLEGGGENPFFNDVDVLVAPRLAA